VATRPIKVARDSSHKEERDMTPVRSSDARARRRAAPRAHHDGEDARRAAAERLAARVVEIAALNSYGRRSPARG
jgi:hypothetical protein